MRPPRAARSREVTRLLAEAVRHHQGGRLDEAAGRYRRVLQRYPGDADAAHLLGLIAHQRGDHTGALEWIDQALAGHPEAAAFHNSRGVVLLALGRTEEAANGFRAAVARDPMLAEAHNNLGNALQGMGAHGDAVASYEAALRLRPDYAEAWCNQGRALHLLEETADAVERLRRAIALQPEYIKAQRYLADALASLGARQEAEALYRQVLARPSEEAAEAAAGLAALLEKAGSLDEAVTAADAALVRDPGNLRARVVAARAERRRGRAQAALDRLGSADFADAEPQLRGYALLERAACLDRVGDYDAAFRAAVEGNTSLAAVAEAAGIDRDFFPRLIARLAERFTEAWVATWTRTPPLATPPPIFLIGFPRSGTTLLDQILDSHPGLTTMEERDCLDVVRRAIDRLPNGYPDALETLSAQSVEELRQLYHETAARYLGGAPAGRLVDKMPLNTIDAGLIHRLFPGAPILLALRHPCDVVLSNFLQAFQPNAAMVQFDDLIRGASFYVQVMALWQRYRRILPLSVHAIRYEDLVADLEGETRRILEFLDLPWDPVVLSFAEHARGRAIATPSYHQVAEPLYRRSVERWRNYREALAPVWPALKPWIEAFGYAAG